MEIRNAAKQYKRQVEIQDMLYRSAYREQAARVKDSMKAEIKGVPVRQVTKGRHKTEEILTTVGVVGFSMAALIGYTILEDKLR